MKRSLPLLAVLVTALVLVVGTTGCSTQRIDWAPRVGNYSFDDAVREFGPPDKRAELTDGTIVADWITSRGGPRVYTSPRLYHGYYGGHYGWSDTYTVNTPDWILRLEFGPDGKLKDRKKVVQ